MLVGTVFMLLFFFVDVERMEKEAEEERLRKQRAAVERAFHEGLTKAKLVMRRAPLGTDRNHNRYSLYSYKNITIKASLSVDMGPWLKVLGERKKE